MPQILSDRIVWDENDWLAGLAPQHANNSPLTVGQRGAAFMRNINPFRRLGGICPGFSPQDIGNVGEVDGILTGADADVTGATPYAYLIQGVTSSTKLHRLNLNTDTIDATGGFPRTISTLHGHSAVVGQEVLVTSVGSSTMVLYSMVDSTDGDIGAYDATGGVFYDTFMSSMASGGAVLTTDYHPMVKGDDGADYFGDGRALKKFDGESGSNGTVTTVFNLPRGFTIRSFSKSLNYLIVYASRSNAVSSSYYRGVSLAWFWNYLSDRPNYTYTISDNYVVGGFNWNGTPGCFSYGRPGETRAISCRMQLFNGNGFEEVAILNRNPPGNHGVEIYDSMVVWNFGNDSQSFIAGYGSPWRNRVPGGLHFLAEPTGLSQTASIGGICRIFAGFGLYASSGASSSGGLQRFSSNFGPEQTDGAFWQGLLAAPFFPRGQVGKVKGVRMMYRNAASGGRTLTVTLVTDFRGDTTNTVVNALSSVTGATLTRDHPFDTSDAQLPYFTSIAPNLSWSVGSGSADAPTPYRIEVFFEPVKMPVTWT